MPAVFSDPILRSKSNRRWWSAWNVIRWVFSFLDVHWGRPLTTRQPQRYARIPNFSFRCLPTEFPKTVRRWFAYFGPSPPLSFFSFFLKCGKIRSLVFGLLHKTPIYNVLHLFTWINERYEGLAPSSLAIETVSRLLWKFLSIFRYKVATF